MNEQIKAIGQSFKDKREEMHLSLKEVENATSIRMMYLQAIEEGQIEKFLSPIYAIGFVKQYASFLGFDADKLLKDNPHAFSTKMAKQEFAYGIGTLDQRPTPSHGIKSWSNLVWIGVSLLVLLAAWYVGKLSGIL